MFCWSLSSVVCGGGLKATTPRTARSDFDLANPVNTKYSKLQKSTDPLNARDSNAEVFSKNIERSQSTVDDITNHDNLNASKHISEHLAHLIVDSTNYPDGLNAYICAQLAESIKTNTKLKEICISQVSLNDDQFNQLLPSIAACQTLQVLNLQYNNLSSRSIIQLAMALEMHPTISKLYIDNQDTIESEEPIALSENYLINMLSQNIHIIELNYSFMLDYISFYAEQYIQRNKGNLDQIAVIERYPFPMTNEQHQHNKKIDEIDEVLYGTSGGDKNEEEDVGLERMSIPISESNRVNPSEMEESVNQVVDSSDSDIIHPYLPRSISAFDPDSTSTSGTTITSHTRASTSERVTMTKAYSTSSVDVNYAHHASISSEITTPFLNDENSRKPFKLPVYKDRKYVPARYDNHTEINITHLNSTHNNSDFYKGLAEQIRNNTVLTSLTLANMGMRDTDCIMMIKALYSCSSLKKLNFESNRLTVDGIIAISKFIGDCMSLEEVKIDNQYNTIGYEGEKALVEALNHNPFILKLSYTFKNPTFKNYASMSLRKNAERKRVSRIKGRVMKSTIASNSGNNSLRNSFKETSTETSNGKVNTLGGRASSLFKRVDATAVVTTSKQNTFAERMNLYKKNTPDVKDYLQQQQARKKKGDNVTLITTEDRETVTPVSPHTQRILKNFETTYDRYTLIRLPKKPSALSSAASSSSSS